MLKRVATVLLFLLLAAAAIAQPNPQNPQVQSVAFQLNNPPSPVASASVSLTGNPGPRTVYFWLVSNYLIGNSSVAGPFILQQAPNAFTGSNFATVSWIPPTAGGTYDLLMTSTAVAPTGACSCAVATAISGVSQNVTSETLSSYTVTSVDTNKFTISLINRQYGLGRSSLSFIIPSSGIDAFDVVSDGTANYDLLSANSFAVGLGNTTYNKFRLSMDSLGTFYGDFINNAGTKSNALHEIFDYTYFTPAPSSFSQGVFGISTPLWSWDMTGALVLNGTENIFAMPDPVDVVCKVTHVGLGGTGVKYCVRWLESNSGYSNCSQFCTDNLGFNTGFDANHYNVVTWWQDSQSLGVNGYGGSWSNVMLARNSLSQNDAINSILDLHGGGVLSQLSSCIFPGSLASPPTDPSCSYTDKGTAPITTLPTLAGVFYDGTGGNSTPKGIIPRLFVGYGTPAGSSLGGGTINIGRLVTQAISDPTAPTVTANNTGSDTCAYAIVVHDYTINGVTNPSPFTTIHNCNNASQNVSISWTVNAFCTSVDLLKGDASHSLKTGLSCIGTTTAGGFGTPNPYTFTDTGQSTTGGYTATNNTADIVSAGNIFAIAASNATINGKFIVAVNNVTAPFVIGNNGTTTGEATLGGGDATRIGTVNWYAPDQVTRIAHMGGDLASSNNVTLTLDAAGTFGIANGGFKLPFTGSTQCLQVDLSGLVGVTGAPCGSGGSGTVSSSTKTFTAGYFSNGTVVSGYADAAIPASMYSVVADGTDQCGTNLNSLVSAANAAHKAILFDQGVTLLATCDLVGSNSLAPGVILKGRMQSQSDVIVPGPATSTVLKMTNSGSVAHIECLTRGGQCGAENLTVRDDTTSTPFFLFTGGIPYLERVTCWGRHDRSAGQQPDNDCVWLGNGSNTTCTNSENDGYCDYGNEWINISAHNISRGLVLGANASAARGFVFGDESTGNVDGSLVAKGGFVEFVGQAGNTAYGSNLLVTVEVAQFSVPHNCNFLGAVRFVSYATNNNVMYNAADVGLCAYTARIEDNTSTNNKVTVISGAGTSGTVFDGATGATAAVPNVIEDQTSPSFNPSYSTSLLQARFIDLSNSGVMGWTASTYSAARDTGFSRVGPATVDLGNGSFGDATGTFNAAHFTINSVSGSTQCLHVNSSGVMSGFGSDCGLPWVAVGPQTATMVNTGGVFIGSSQQILASTLTSGEYKLVVNMFENANGTDCDTFASVELLCGFTDLDTNALYSLGGTTWIVGQKNGTGTFTAQFVAAATSSRGTTIQSENSFRLKNGTALTCQMFQVNNNTKAAGACTAYPQFTTNYKIQGPN